MVLVVVVEPSGDLVKRGRRIRDRMDADIVALKRFHERLAHTIALRAGHWREARDEVELNGEAAGLDGGVRRAVVGQPLDGRGSAQAVKACLDGLRASSRARPIR